MNQQHNNSVKQKVVIIGAGPAGLTAAYELLSRNKSYQVEIFEINDYCGGLSATINFKGNRIDIGGHRFYSKSSWVMDWWQRFLPLQKEHDDHRQAVMLKRRRLSRILFKGQLFTYPLTLSWNIIRKFSPIFLLTTLAGYIKSQLVKPLPETNLENFYINRFGKSLYKTFFKAYTEKVWGVACNKIDPAWGPQRIKNLSIFKAIQHSLQQVFNKDDGIEQKNTSTSLIERFLYPKQGPGQLWQKVADEIVENGGQINYRQKLIAVRIKHRRVEAVQLLDVETGQKKWHATDYLISSMPLKSLIAGLSDAVPETVQSIAGQLCYRDYMIVGILIKRSPETKKLNELHDNWLYIQEEHLKLGRVQLFHNWSEALVADPENLWLGLEYFCRQNDELWSLNEQSMIEMAVKELYQTGLISNKTFLDATVLRVPKAYPAYWGSFGQIDKVYDFIDKIENLYAIGRNGMHRYNNQDHSMLTAKSAIECILDNKLQKNRIWKINSESEYLENQS